jgi:hypothetical protein
VSHPAGGVLATALNGDLAPSHGVDRVIQRLSTTGQRYFYSSMVSSRAVDWHLTPAERGLGNASV